MRADSWSKILILLLVIGAVLLVVFGFFSIRLILRAEDQKVYYEQILDAIPLPITVTDLEMKWTFVNKAVEGMIGVDRASIYGHHCSEWKADICNTDKCGVAVLRKGGNSSVFQNSGNHRYYQTNVSYIQNIRNENIGHVETVTDVDDQKKLENMVSTMTRIVTQLATGANQVSDSSQSLSQGATEQAASLEQITSSMDELSSQTRQNAENSSQANELAQKTQTLAQNGLSQMEQMMASIGNIQSSSNEISKIIKVIDDIAFQTNLLALNAAVEAARAGRHGKGFAVVAQEVRNLANKSAKAAQQTSGLIEDTVKKVDTGSANAETVVDFLIGIVESIDKVANLSNEMATASSEQALGISQINQGLNQIEKVTQQNTANAEETASASAELSSTAAQLRRLVSGFESGNQDSDSKEKNERGGAQPPKRIPQKPSHQDGWEDHRPSDQKSQSLNPEDLISLDDDDFGKY